MLRKASLALATSVALVSVVAAGAAYAAPQAYNAESNQNYGFGPRVTVHPNDVVTGNRVIGRDPDPSIRDQLLREYDSGRGE
jgi:hypothetical protein